MLMDDGGVVVVVDVTSSSMFSREKAKRHHHFLCWCQSFLFGVYLLANLMSKRGKKGGGREKLRSHIDSPV